MNAYACAADVVQLPDGPVIKVHRGRRARVEVVTERSARTMNHMDPETKMVHSRLEKWGKWSRDCEARAWPEATMLGRLIEQGPMGAAQSGKPPISMPDDVAAVDAAVARLGDIDKGVIKSYYMRWETIETTARRNGMRLRQLQNVLRRARWRVAIYLAGIDAATA
jgi:hypothetical protein